MPRKPTVARDLVRARWVELDGQGKVVRELTDIEAVRALPPGLLTWRRTSIGES